MSCMSLTSIWKFFLLKLALNFIGPKNPLRPGSCRVWKNNKQHDDNITTSKKSRGYWKYLVYSLCKTVVLLCPIICATSILELLYSVLLGGA